jgi:hypothetical protein
MAIAFSIAHIIKFLPQMIYAYHGSPIRLRDLVSSLWRPFVPSLISAVTVYLFSINHSLSNLMIVFLIKFLIFVIVYISVWCVLPGGRAQLKDLSGIRAYMFNKKPANLNPPSNTVGAALE